MGKTQIQKWIEEGKKYIAVKLQTQWEEEVNQRFESISHGQEILCALELMKKFASNEICTTQDIDEFFSANKISEADEYMTKDLLRKFSQKYIEIYQNIDIEK